MTNPTDPAFSPCSSEENYEHGEVFGLTKREHFAGLNYAAILGKIAFDQPAEDMLKKAGIAVKDFEAYAAHLATSGADALIADLNCESKPPAPNCQHDWQPTGQGAEQKCAKCGETMPF